MDTDSTNYNHSQETVKGSWKCAGCGAEMTELPFEPSGDRPIYCKACWMKNREQGKNDFKPRKMFQGDWKCSECGAEITELPFEPASDQALLCKACWIKKRNQ